MKILVTGGYGFIGSNFVNMLNTATKHQVVILDNFTYAANMNHVMLKNKTYNVDIRNTKMCEEIFVREKPDCVVNFAAESHVDNSIKTPNIFYETNILGAANMLNLSREYACRMLQVSTDEVYGTIGGNDESVETDRLLPNSPYSSSKASADLIARSCFETYKQDVVITRCCNNYGPNQHFEKMIPTIIRHMKNGTPVPVYGDGKNIREWIHAYDHCAGILTVIDRGESGEIYNIGTGDRLTNLELIDAISKAKKQDIKISFVEDRKGHDLRYAINSEKIRSLGWLPKYSIADGFALL